MSYLMFSARNDRLALFDKQTEKFVGLLIAPLPGESAAAFTHQIGPLHHAEEIANLKDFPEWSDLQFFAIEFFRPGEEPY